MLHYLVTVSALVASILLVRAIFKKSVPQRLIYALWLVVLVRICMPLSLFDLEFTLPMGAGTGSVESEPFLDAYDNLPSL